MAVFRREVFFPATKNPFPELVEGNMFANKLRRFESLSDHCHPELDSGSVQVLAECFTDPESSSG